MTDYTRNLRNAATLHLVTTSNYAGNGTAAYLDAQYSDFDAFEYQRDIAAGLMIDCIKGDWNNVWTADENAYATADEAEQAADRMRADGTTGVTVLEITLDDIEAALNRNFAAPDNYPLHIGNIGEIAGTHAQGAYISNGALMRDANARGQHFYRVIAATGTGNDRQALIELADEETRAILTNANIIWDDDNDYYPTLEAMDLPATLHIHDPYLRGTIIRADGDETDISFDWIESADGWNAAADKALAEFGWERIGAWDHMPDNTPLKRINRDE